MLFDGGQTVAIGKARGGQWYGYFGPTAENEQRGPAALVLDGAPKASAAAAKCTDDR